MSNNPTGAANAAPTPTRWQVAAHEAAHAVYAHRQGLGVWGVEISSVVAQELSGEGGVWLGRCRTSLDGELAGARHGRLGRVLSLVGIPAANRAGWPEALLPWDGFVRRAGRRFVEPPWDPEAAERMLTDLRLRLSDEEHVLLAVHLTEGVLGSPESSYEAARSEAEAFVGDHWREIAALAGRLTEKVRLDSSDVSEALGPGWAEFREMLDAMAREDDTTLAERLAEG